MPSKVPPIVAVDTCFLVRALVTARRADDEHKAWHFIERMEKARHKLVVPMPALAEYLVRADTASLEIVEQLERKAYVEAKPFDRAAAFECAQMDAAARGRGDKRDGSRDSWQKVKIDRQIVAIAKSVGAELIITDDDSVKACALRVGIPSMRVSDLSLPPEVRQGTLPLKGKPRRS